MQVNGVGFFARFRGRVGLRTRPRARARDRAPLRMRTRSPFCSIRALFARFRGRSGRPGPPHARPAPYSSVPPVACGPGVQRRAPPRGPGPLKRSVRARARTLPPLTRTRIRTDPADAGRVLEGAQGAPPIGCRLKGRQGRWSGDSSIPALGHVDQTSVPACVRVRAGGGGPGVGQNFRLYLI